MEKIFALDFDNTCIDFDCSDRTTFLFDKNFTYTDDKKWYEEALYFFAWMRKSDVLEKIEQHNIVWNIIHQVYDLYKDCKSKWYKVYCVTASLRFIVEVFADHFGYEFDHILWAELYEDNWILMKKTKQLPAFESKPQLLLEIYWSYPDIACGDSKNDFWLLSSSKEAYFVWKNEAIRKEAKVLWWNLI